MKEIKYDRTVLFFLNELTEILIEKGYFSFHETSMLYMRNMVDFIKNNIETIPHKIAPSYFVKYGNNLFYIPYKRNKQTTWYIFFEKTEQHYFIRYITNNHMDGQYF